MKTVRRLTATLIALLALYVLGYWFLIKKDWAFKLRGLKADRVKTEEFIILLHDVFRPLVKLDHFLSVVVPMRNRLTGNWISATTSDFVVFGPDQKCRFELGDFAFDGRAKYDALNSGFIMEFPHRDRLYVFCLRDLSLTNPFGLTPPAFGTADHANAFVGRVTDHLNNATIDYKATLTKQPPSAPAP